MDKDPLALQVEQQAPLKLASVYQARGVFVWLVSAMLIKK